MLYGRERDALTVQVRETHGAAASANRKLKDVRVTALESELRSSAQIKDLQGKLKAADATLRCGPRQGQRASPNFNHRPAVSPYQQFLLASHPTSLNAVDPGRTDHQ